MKPTLSLRSFLLGSSLLAASPLLHATAFYWDGTDTGANANGGTGTWNTSTTNWDNAATAGASLAWVNGNNQAVFAGTAGTVTLGAAITVQGTGGSGTAGISFGTTGYIVDGTNTISLGGATQFNVNGTTFQSGVTVALGASRSLTIGSGLVSSSFAGVFSGTGTSGITVGGGGTLTFSGTNNSYTGNFRHNGGTIVEFASIAASGANSSLGAGTTIELGTASNGTTNTIKYLGSGTQSTNRTISLNTTNGALTHTIDMSGTGTLTFTGNLTSASGGSGTKTFALTGSTTGAGVFQGNIVNAGSGTNTAFTKSGTGTWTLSGTNTYTGNTLVSGGTLITTKAVSLAGYTVASRVNINGGTLGVQVGGAGGWTPGEVDTLLTNAVKTSGALGIDTTNGSLTQWTTFVGAGNFGALGLTKLGTNKLTLDQANTYTGATTVAEGTLAVDGSLANTATTVQSGGTLQGSGTIGGSVTIQSGGTLATGNSIESLATGALNLNNLSTFAYEMDKSVSATVAGDLTAVTGNLTIASGAILTLTELGTLGSWTAGEKLTLISYSGTLVNNLFSYGLGTIADDSTISFSGVNWLFDYNDTVAGSNYTSDLTGSSFVTMTVVPEPGAALLGSLGMLALLRRRRN